MAGAAPTAKPAPFLKPLDILDRGVLLAESSLSFVILLVMVIMAVASAVGGALGIQNAFLASAEEVMMYGTIWAAFFGASFATRGRKHLAIDAVGRLLPDRIRRFVVAIACGLGAMVAGFLAHAIYENLLEAAHEMAETARQNVAMGLDANASHAYEFYFAIPGGFLLIAIRLVLHSFHEFMAALGGVSVDVTPAAEHGHGEKYAPIAEATAPEVMIALAAQVVLVALAFGLNAVELGGPLAVAVGLAALTLLVPFLKRKQATGTFDPPARAQHAWMNPKPVLIASGLVLSAATLGIAYKLLQILPQQSIGMGVGFFAIMAFMGAPLFTILGGLAYFLWSHGTETVPATEFSLAVEDILGGHFAKMSVLPTIPIFTLAGYIMSEARTAERLVRVSRAWLGWMPGGLAIAAIVASTFFTVFSGASGITIVAIGGLLFPSLLKDRYPEKFSLGLVTSGGALGVTFYPCLPLIVYGIIAGLQEVPPGFERLSIDKFRFAGLLPGLLLIGLLCVWAVIVAVRSKVERSAFDGKEALASLRGAFWELILPIFPFVGLFLGGPLLAAAMTAAYVLVIEVFVYRDISLTKDLPRIIPDSMVLVGAIFVKLCAATILMAFFVQDQTADRIFETLTCGPPAQAYLEAHSDTLGTCREAVNILGASNSQGMIDSPIKFLLALNVLLLVVGMFMDIFSAIVVIVPLITGIALAFNINPYHLGIVFLLNLEIGYLMPPMGLNLFIAGFRFNKPVPALYPVVLPFIAIFAIALLVTTYVPELTLAMVPDADAALGHAHEGGTPAPTAPPDGTEEPPSDAPAVPAPTPAADCDEPREGESFEDFDRRCSVTGGAAAPGTPAAPAAVPANAADCDQPRDGESFEDFDRRCSVTGAAAPAAAPAAEPANAPAPAAPAQGGAEAADCDQPRPGESFEDFDRRCHITE